MRTPGFVPNDAGLRAFLQSAPIRAACLNEAARLADEMKQALPHHSGDLQGSVAVEGADIAVRTRKGGWSTRAGARVGPDIDYAAAVEARSGAIAKLVATSRKGR